MKQKLRTFPDDWSKMPLEEVLKNLQYLLKNYKKYPVSHPCMDHMQIGNVLIYPYGGGFARVNEKQIYSPDVRGMESITAEEKLLIDQIFGTMHKLYKKCTFYRLSFMGKVDDLLERTELFSEYNGRPGFWIIGALIVVFLAAGGVSKCSSKRRAKKAAIEKQVQEHAETLPGYENYLDVAAEIERYRDSIKSAQKTKRTK